MLTQSHLSKFVCAKCDTQIKEISLFVKSISDIQKKFYKHLNLDFNLTSSKAQNSLKSSSTPSNAKKHSDNPLNLSSPPEDIVIKCEAFDASYGDIKEEDNAQNPSSSFLFDSSTFLQFYKQENARKNESENIQRDDGTDLDPIGDDPKIKPDVDELQNVSPTQNFNNIQQDSDSDWFNDDPVDDFDEFKDEKCKKSKAKANTQQGKKRGSYKKSLNSENFICDICGEC